MEKESSATQDLPPSEEPEIVHCVICDAEITYSAKHETKVGPLCTNCLLGG